MWTLKERYLVTASVDKTARVWDLTSGKLLQVLRPPIGPGDEGKLYAVAISPDGETVSLFRPCRNLFGLLNTVLQTCALVTRNLAILR
jgi:hypothetical protein